MNGCIICFGSEKGWFPQASRQNSERSIVHQDVQGLLVKTPTIEDSNGSFNSQAALAPGLRIIIGFVLAAKRVDSLQLPAKTQRGP